MAAAPPTWRVALHGGALEPKFVTVKFDPAQHTSVGGVAEAAAAKLGQAGVAQIHLDLFRVSEAAAKPSWAHCNAVVDDPSSNVDLSISLKAAASRDATLPNKAWFVLKISSPAAAPAAGEFCADALVLAPAVLPGAAAAVSPPPSHVVLRGSVLSRVLAPCCAPPCCPTSPPPCLLCCTARLMCCRRWRSCHVWSRCVCPPVCPVVLPCQYCHACAVVRRLPLTCTPASTRARRGSLMPPLMGSLRRLAKWC